MTPSVEQLCAAAKRLNLRWHAHAPNVDDCIVAFENPEVAYLEHLCHELAHAVLLGVKPGARLANRVEAAVTLLQHNEGHEAGEENETHTFAVVMGVLDRFGVRYDESDMLVANKVQVHYSSDREIREEWRCFRRTPEFNDAVATVSQVILSETLSTGPELSTPLPPL